MMLLQGTKKPIKTTYHEWSDEVTETLRGCFESTDWGVFQDDDTNNRVTAVSQYINFCVESIVPTKTRWVFPNSKPWLSKDLKVLMKQKHVAYHNKDYETARTRQREIKREIKRCKYQYGKKLERKFQCNDSRAAWKVMSTITGLELKKSDTAHATMDFINELNQFYCRFDEIDFSSCNSI
ncbi:hypothetical protein BSL78_08860 [Apostichopus japonicus]|uniref:Uncharacterized protein n=1 Tax=Stichopus japonicus TaxID=307972 RepID=A0A2G8L1V1_STIJA|nr:hypothetical protein BSL78_08860 [Apostichopus japonicus]